MNKGLKNFLIAAAICIGIGLLLVIGSVVFGGFRLTRDGSFNHHFCFSFPFSVSFDDGDFEIAVSDDEFDMEDGKTPEITVFSKEQADNLEISFDTGLLQIEKGAGDEIEVQHTGKAKINQKGNTLEIICAPQHFWGKSKNKIKVSVPEGKKWNAVSIETSAGKVELKDVHTDILEIDLDAGDASVEGLQCMNAEAELDAGQIVMKNTSVKNLESDVDMGSFEYEGVILKNCDVSVDAGNVLLKLDQEEDEFNYHIQSELGNIVVGGQGYAGTARSSVNNENAGGNMNLDCDMGAIEVIFNGR